MRLSAALGFMFAIFTAGSASAATVLSCGFNGGPVNLSGSSCYSLASFSFNETLDWQDAYGTADAGAHSTTYDPVASGSPWMATTSGGLSVGASFGPLYTGTNVISRKDNFFQVYQDGSWMPTFLAPGYMNWETYAGTFDSQPNPGAGSPGDHLLYTSGGMGALKLEFGTAISGAMFRISTPSSGDVNATIMAYATLTPTALDTPLMTYTINAHATGGTPNPAGTCAGLALAVPVPCNNAPYIGIQTGSLNIRSLVISTPDPYGVFISTLYLNDSLGTEAPEPGTFALMGVAGVAVLIRRRIVRSRQS